MQGYELIEQDIQKVKNLGVKVMQRNIATVQDEYIRHDPDAVAQAIIELVCEDLKFKDKQNDMKYMLLNDRLKSSKKHNKRIKRNREKKNKKQLQGKSKFFEKYQDRISSIQESDIKLKEKEKLNKMQEKLRKKQQTKITKRKAEVKKEEINVQMPNKIDQLDENERKKIIDTINKLRR